MISILSPIGYPGDTRQDRFWPLVFVAAALSMTVCALVHRHLYGDGSYFMVLMLQKRGFTTFDISRQFAHYILEGPVLAAINWFHVADVRVLSWIFGLTLFLHPVASLWGCWHILKRRNRSLMILPALCWACLTLCTSFFIISESWVGISLFWPIYFLLLYDKHRLGKLEAILLVILCAASIRVYEGFFVQAALLAFLACRRIRRWLKHHTLDIAASLGLLCMGVAIWADLYWSAFPRDPDNRIKLALGIFGLLIYPGAYISAFALFLFVQTKHIGSKVMTRGSLIFLAAAFAWALMSWIYVPSIMAYMHAVIRSINNLLPVALGLLPFAAIKFRSLRPTFSRVRRTAFAGFTLAVIVWQFGSCLAWYRYTRDFSRILSSDRGYVALHDTKLSRYGFDWSWSMPCMSVILSAIDKKPLRSVVLNPPDHRWEPFDPKLPETFPKLEGFGVRYEIKPR